MEVHPPHGSIHNWRDFFIHLITITVGLLIALGLEGLVEVQHNRHLLHQAEANLSGEIRDNEASLSRDEKELIGEKRQIENNLALLASARARGKTQELPGFRWQWNGMQSSAWETARNTGALALMPYDAGQRYSVIYAQQAAVDEQARIYIHDVTRSSAPLQGRKLTDLQPADLDAIVRDQQQALADLKLLRDLGTSLERIYNRSRREQ